MIDTVRWKQQKKEALLPGKIRLIDQTKLPELYEFIETDDVTEVYHAIKRLSVRGAPAIGIAAAFGLTIAVQNFTSNDKEAFLKELQKHADYLNSSRPTAVNLSWALNRCCQKIIHHSSKQSTVENLKNILIQEALIILEEDIEMCKKIGHYGVSLIKKKNAGILTHCNAGALATGDYGTALSPIYTAQNNGLEPKVFADETRPLLQGARLTAWELQKANIDITVICDNMAAKLMQEKKIDLVITGADRVAANGDSANKIGTYSLAINAKYHNIPFYIAIPYSTIDPSLASGDLIPIEERDSSEITCGFGKKTVPEKVKTYNPAFDVTPASLIKGIITDKGILYPPFKTSIRKIL